MGAFCSIFETCAVFWRCVHRSVSQNQEQEFEGILLRLQVTSCLSKPSCVTQASGNVPDTGHKEGSLTESFLLSPAVTVTHWHALGDAPKWLYDAPFLFYFFPLRMLLTIFPTRKTMGEVSFTSRLKENLYNFWTTGIVYFHGFGQSGILASLLALAVRKFRVKFIVTRSSDIGDYDAIRFYFCEIIQTYKNYREYITNIHIPNLRRKPWYRWSPLCDQSWSHFPLPRPCGKYLPGLSVYPPHLQNSNFSPNVCIYNRHTVLFCMF